MAKILLIDNYDSFTYNLVHYLYEEGADVSVVRNDAVTAEDIVTADYQGVVISPGPCDPPKAGVCLDFLRKNAQKETPLPVFGVCLGHQSIAEALGGTVIRAALPMHGKTSKITHSGQGVFAGLPSPMEVTRDHSLIVERDSLPDHFMVTSETEDGINYGVTTQAVTLSRCAVPSGKHCFGAWSCAVG